MNNQLIENLTDDEDILELIDIVQNRRRPRTFRKRENHFEKWNDAEFHQRFRFSEKGVRFILNLIEEDITSATNWNHAVTAELKLLVTLRFYASGSFLQVVSDFGGIDKSTASRIIYKVSQALASLYRHFIRMPGNEEECKKISQKFYNIRRFPRCIGAID